MAVFFFAAPNKLIPEQSIVPLLDLKMFCTIKSMACRDEEKNKSNAKLRIKCCQIYSILWNNKDRLASHQLTNSLFNLFFLRVFC